MIDFQSAILGGIGFVVVLAVFYWILLKTTSLGDDEHDVESTEDRLTMGDTERHHRVGFRHRVSRQTPMMKAFMASIVVLLVYLAIMIYRVAATGRPTEVMYAGYAEQAIFGAICVGTGVWFKAKQDAKAGEIQIMREKDNGNDRRTVKYNRSLARDTGDDSKLVPELKEDPFLGLFWRPRLNADDPELRDADGKLPDDLVLWEVPTDESAVWDERTGEVTVRAKDWRVVENPNRAADYEIVPSDRKSQSEIRDLKTENSELEAELRKERVQNGILSESLEEIENILTNEEYDSLQRIKQARESLEEDRPPREYHYDDRARPDRGRDQSAASSD